MRAVLIRVLSGTQGELERRAVTRGKAIREVYRASRKAHWGGTWPADASIYRDNK
jgi:ribosomal protein RSM22 (predicted rRNA methylase)